MCCVRLPGKSEEKNTAPGVTRTSLAQTEMCLSVCDLEYACDIPGRLMGIQGGDDFIFCPISKVNLCLRQSEHAAELCSQSHSR